MRVNMHGYEKYIEVSAQPAKEGIKIFTPNPTDLLEKGGSKRLATLYNGGLRAALLSLVHLGRRDLGNLPSLSR